jgi:hypothetical protein
MKLTKKRLNKIIQSNNKQTRKHLKKDKKYSSNPTTLRNRRQFNLRVNTLKKY